MLLIDLMLHTQSISQICLPLNLFLTAPATVGSQVIKQDAYLSTLSSPTNLKNSFE